ncbi:hypothetical protein D1872_232180 [compost metagenome]
MRILLLQLKGGFASPQIDAVLPGGDYPFQSFIQERQEAVDDGLSDERNAVMFIVVYAKLVGSVTGDQQVFQHASSFRWRDSVH